MSIDTLVHESGIHLSGGNVQALPGQSRSWVEQMVDEVKLDFFYVAGPVSSHPRFKDMLAKAMSSNHHGAMSDAPMDE